MVMAELAAQVPVDPEELQQALEAFMREQEKEAAERNAPKRAGKAGKRKGKSGDEEP